MKKSLINFQQNQVQIKMDMPAEVFRYFANVIQNNILLEWVETKKIDKIKETIESFISDSIKRDYIIVIAVNPAFNLSHKKKYYLSIKMNNITVFIYQAKPTEFPRFSQIKSSQVQDVTSVQLTFQANFKDSDFANLEKIRICAAEILMSEKPDWETELVIQAKNRLSLYYQPGFWQVFCSKKIGFIVQQLPSERVLEFSLQKNNDNYKLIAFQKRGPEFNFREKIKLKIREIISFTVLLTFFMLLVGCKDENHKPQESTWFSSGAKEQICSHRSELLGLCAIILFGLLAQRMMKKHIDKANKRKVQ